MSEEHIFGKWVAHQFKISINRMSHQLIRANRPGKNDSYDYAESNEISQGGPLNWSAYNVCQACNNGWLSNIHTEAKTLVSQLAHGWWPKFTEAEALVLARWVAMVVINRGTIGRTEGTSKQQRQALMTGEMPTGFRIQIGFVEERRLHGTSRYAHFMLELPSADGQVFDTVCCYFVIRNIVFFCTIAPSDPALQYIYQSVLAANPLREIWPHNEDPSDLQYFTLDRSTLDAMIPVNWIPRK